MSDDNEGGTTLDAPSLRDIEEWQADAKARESGPQAAAPIRFAAPAAPLPSSAAAVVPVAQPEPPASDPSPPAVVEGQITDWMSPEELQATLEAGAEKKKPRGAVPVRNVHSDAVAAPPSWLVPAIAVAAFVLLFASVALVLLFA